MTRHKTEQETFWAGEFGDEYIRRNQGQAMVASNIALFAHSLRRTDRINSVLELGANVGINMVALHSLFPPAEMHAVEINASACAQLAGLRYVNAVNQSILEYSPARTFDLVLAKGVLIHIDPTALPEVYDKLFHASHRYIMVMEYYNPTPVEVGYRGHRNRLFKRDFAGELMLRHPSVKLLDYGFAYHGDPKWPQDDTTWFLMEKEK